MNDPIDPDSSAPQPQQVPVTPARRFPGLGRRGATAALAAGLVVGGAAGGYIVSHAASSPGPSASPSAAPSGPHHGRGLLGGPSDRADDAQVIAGAIGISTAQLRTELMTGKTIAQVAQGHGVQPSKVVDALVADESKEIDAAVSAGRITKAQGDQLRAGVRQRVQALVDGTGRRGPGMGRHGFPGAPGARAADDQAIAGAIGISIAQLHSELQTGETIAQVAQAHGVAAQKVIDALIAAENKEIDTAVSSGRISSAQGDRMKSMTVQRVTALVNGTFGPGRGPGAPRPGFWFGYGGPGAPSGSGSPAAPSSAV